MPVVGVGQTSSTAFVLMAAVGADVVIVVVGSVEVAGLTVQAACASMVHIKIRINRSLVVILGLLGSSDTKRPGDRNGSLTFFLRKHSAKGRVTPSELKVMRPTAQNLRSSSLRHTTAARFSPDHLHEHAFRDDHRERHG